MSFVIAFAGFAMLHSLLASEQFKRTLFKRFPTFRFFYRSFYNLVALVSFGILWLFVPVKSLELYSLQPPLNFLFHLIQLSGVIGIIISLKSMTGSFSGLKQLKDVFRDKKPDYYLDEPKQEILYTNGMFAYVRHPLYTFSMLILFFHPYMSLKWLLLSVCSAVYFILGSKLEEKKLEHRFGSDYLNYKSNVPAFIPRLLK